MRTASDQLMIIADEHGYEFWRTRTKTCEGWIAINDGEIERGRSALWKVLTVTANTQFRYQGVSVRAMLASSYLHTGEPELALRLLDDALQMCSQTGEIWTVPELHRMRGVALASEPAEAETCLRAAIHTARQQSARLFELRSVVSLARLWHDKGRRTEARAALTPVYSWFTEGFEEIDLIEGRNLLDRLG